MLLAQTVEDAQKLLNQLPTQEALQSVQSHLSLWILVGAVVVVGVGALFLRRLLYKQEVMPDLQKNQRENLNEYPPPPGVTLDRQLTINNMPVRVRLVVVVPTGKAQEPITVDQIPSLLDGVMRGLSGILKTDKPRIKVWPTQLSIQGFAPAFHRLVTAGEEKGNPSRWIRVAGPARTGQRPILIGLALWAEDACDMGEVTVTDAKQWGEVLEIIKVD